MKRYKPIEVPAGIRYISNWKEYNFSMTPGRCIIDKKITGCGFTEFYLTNSENVILCSPRVMLLNSKYKKHLKKNNGVEYIYLVNKGSIKDSNVDKDLFSEQTLNRNQKVVIKVLGDEEKKSKKQEKRLSYEELYREIETYINRMKGYGRPFKILVTYDSYHLVKKVLSHMKLFNSFTTMVDEFQTILQDSSFKADTEQSFMNVLEDVEKVHFVSATPMLDKYLELLPEFKDLDYYSIDWLAKDPNRLKQPDLDIRVMKTVNVALKPIIESYRKGKFDKVYRRDINGELKEIVSDEAVFYVNSVNHIISAIKKFELKPEEVNILCADTPENRDRLKAKLGTSYTIGDIPMEDEKPKMFTFCTRTVYLGADFYSKCARSFVFGDANIQSLAIDISQDLPQILGRQRLPENPWNNSIVFFYRATCGYNKFSKEEFDEVLNKKMEYTKTLLGSLEKVSPTEKQALIKAFQTVNNSVGYKESYISIDGFGENIKASINNYVVVAEQRAFDIQQIDYKDRCSVFSEVSKVFDSEVNTAVSSILENYHQITQISKRIEFVCELKLGNKVDKDALELFLHQLPENDYAKSYYLSIGPEKCKELQYNVTAIRKLLKDQTFDVDTLESRILKTFKVGERVTKKDIKVALTKIYEELQFSGSPKANDLKQWFEIRETFMTVDGKRVHGFEIVSKK